MDGLELDWMRFGYHFRPGFEEEGAVLLTEFTSDVRRLLDTWETRRGHKIELSARVPSRPATSLALGLDAVEWARRGLISRLVITPFWATSEAICRWRFGSSYYAGRMLSWKPGWSSFSAPTLPRKRCRLIPSGRCAVRLWRFSQGERTDLYLYNYFDCVTCMDDLENYPTLLREVGELDTLRGKPRRHVVTYSDTWAVGEPAGYLLPATVTPIR